MSPLEWDNVGTMVCWHRRYNLGDEQPREDSREFLQLLATDVCPRLADIVDYWDNAGYRFLRDDCGMSHEDACEAIAQHIDNLVTAVLDHYYIILPLYLYDHSGLSMSCSGFSCSWDSGQVGYIYCTAEHAVAECGSLDKARKCLQAEVTTYDQYLQGDVWGYVVEESRHISTVRTVDGIQEEPEESEEWECVDSCWGFYGDDPFNNGMAEHIPEELHPLLRAAEVCYG